MGLLKMARHDHLQGLYKQPISVRLAFVVDQSECAGRRRALIELLIRDHSLFIRRDKSLLNSLHYLLQFLSVVFEKPPPNNQPTTRLYL